MARQVVIATDIHVIQPDAADVAAEKPKPHFKEQDLVRCLMDGSCYIDSDLVPYDLYRVEAVDYVANKIRLKGLANWYDAAKFSPGVMVGAIYATCEVPPEEPLRWFQRGTVQHEHDLLKLLLISPPSGTDLEDQVVGYLLSGSYPQPQDQSEVANRTHACYTQAFNYFWLPEQGRKLYKIAKIVTDEDNFAQRREVLAAVLSCLPRPTKAEFVRGDNVLRDKLCRRCELLLNWLDFRDNSQSKPESNS